MCGIALILSAERDASGLLTPLAAMHDDLASRGPDGQGVLLLDRRLQPHRFAGVPGPESIPPGGVSVAAAFRRLAVRDTRDEAAQPFGSRDGSLWILHNGEIYNDDEIRRELAGEGVSFETRSDAETILAAYDIWGDSCFERLRGMWAVVILDASRRRLVVCRDRLGIKPLFYARSGHRLAFASHPRAIARAFATGPDPSRWRRFLSGLPSDDPNRSFFKGVHAVPAGCLVSFDPAAPAPNPLPFHRFWSLGGVVASVEPPDGQAAATFRELLESATREHLVSDRPTGCLLSGGLDSSLVACLASRQPPAPPPTGISIVFDDPRMSEWPYIQLVAAHAGIESRSHTLSPPEAWHLVDDVVHAQGEPLLGQDTIAHYRAFALAREHRCHVVLEGQGADELFAGLPMYEALRYREQLATGAWIGLISALRARARRHGRSVSSMAREMVISPILRGMVRPLHHSHSWLTPGEAGADEVIDAAEPESSSDPSRLNRYLFDLVRRTNLPAVLLIQDRNAMAHGVENRVPFLDHRLVEFAFRLPASAKVGAGRRKRVVWEAAKNVVPSAVLARTDKRAIISRRDWMDLRNGRREALLRMVEGTRLQQAPFIEPARMTRFVHDYLNHRHDDVLAVWRLYTGWRWLERVAHAS
jgi:asparagine synthase (glutamine-hydrolysing)